jgi:hypothetical protein
VLVPLIIVQRFKIADEFGAHGTVRCLLNGSPVVILSMIFFSFF